jgi:hypothetical protein
MVPRDEINKVSLNFMKLYTVEEHLDFHHGNEEEVKHCESN